MSSRRVLFGLWLLLVGCPPLDAETIRIGSKAFTESYVLAEIALQTVQKAGVKAVHRPGMGGTIVLWQALRSGGIDAYPDYTGTIGEQILSAENPLSHAEMRRALAGHGVGMTDSLGFDNTYTMVMRRDVAKRFAIGTISDLVMNRDLEVGLTHEFMERRDGWRTLAARYGLEMQNVRGLEHALAYPALARGDLDVIDAYSTDAKLAELDLVALTDDLGFFPRYEAVFLYRLDIVPAARRALESLAGTFDEARMTRLNSVAERTHDYAVAADLYFGAGTKSRSGVGRVALRIAGWTLRHLQLVAVSLGLAILIGVPLGIRAARPGLLSQIVLGTVGVIYTIPSLALLAALVAVPFLGISGRTAITALFLYSLLPIVRNTAAGLRSIPPEIRESAAALGLEERAQLRRVLLPLAMPTVLAGIKTSAVINVATATLAALIGAGGLGEPILSGLNLNDPALILQGALPAGLLALLVQFGFDGLERWVVSPGLRLDEGRSQRVTGTP
ncbi:MAG: glycine betaine ABC transporter substrate-binding protein [Thermoanaerobaculia bacterium]